MTVSILDEIMKVKRAVAVKIPLLDGLSEHYISSSGLSLLYGKLLNHKKNEIMPIAAI